MGKTTASDFLKQRGFPVADTDMIARQVVEPGQPALNEIVEVFGGDILEVDGLLKRDELARRVFADSSLRQKLESIMHPRIRAQWLAQTGVWQAEKRPVGVIVIPLLFETKSETHFDKIICVACSPETQRERLRSRGWSEEQVEQRIQAQLPTDEKMERSDFVIWTEGTLEDHAQQVDKVLASLTDGD